MRSRSVVRSLLPALLLSFAVAPLSAAQLDRDSPSWRKLLVERVVKIIKKVITTNGDGLLPPNPAPKP